MTRLEEARRFREVFGQEMLDNISHYGFIKKKLWDMQTDLIEEEAAEFLEAADEVFADPENDDFHLKSEAGRWDPTSHDRSLDCPISAYDGYSDPYRTLMCPLGTLRV